MAGNSTAQARADSKAEKTASRLSILWAALGYFAKKRTVRELIPVGEDTKVDVTIEGKIGRAKVSERLVCTLRQSPEQTAAAIKAASLANVVAYLLSRFETADRYAIAGELAAAWSKSQTVPDVDEAIAAETKKLLEGLRTKQTTTKAGNLTATLLEG